MSLGAVTASGFAALHSNQLAALVIVDAGPHVRTSGGQRIRDFVVDTATVGSIDEFLEKAISFNPRRDPRLLRRSLLYNIRATPDGKWMRKNDTRHMDERRVETIIEMRSVTGTLFQPSVAPRWSFAVPRATSSTTMMPRRWRVFAGWPLGEGGQRRSLRTRG
jgi:hypothetical protein